MKNVSEQEKQKARKKFEIKVDLSLTHLSVSDPFTELIDEKMSNVLKNDT